MALMTSMYSYLIFGSIIYAFLHVMNNTYKACSQGSPMTSKVMLPPSCLPAKFLQKTNQPSQKLELGQDGMMMMMMVEVVVVVVLLLSPLTKS
jgi:hypothetical protein